MMLVDTYTGKEYNLLGNDKIVTETLPAGVTEGRFYLNMQVNSDFVADDEITTPVEEVTDQQGIQLYVQDGSTISITTTQGELQTVYISDITGRTQTYNVHGTHVKIRPPVVNGVYTVRVIGSETTRIEKVILNK
jgi:Flp pilus assembly protein TadG